jgi:lysophospholipase L1-like esterase
MRWVGTWAASAQLPDGPGLHDQTERAIVRTSVGGEGVRVRLSNVFGSGPVTFAEASVAAAVGPACAAVVAGSLRRVAFGGRASVTVPAGAEAVSDPVRLRVRPAQDLAISLAVRGATGPATQHSVASATSFLTAAGSGSHVADVDGGPFAAPIGSWLFVAGVDVLTAADGAVVAFGDSITDGYQSTEDANRRYPDVLASLLDGRLGVLNQGISGNRLLRDSPVFGVRALERFDRDVLAQAGARAVVVLLGINDIGQLPHQLDPAPIVAGLGELAARARGRGLRVLGGTLLPFRDAAFDDFATPAGETARQAVNRWIRTGGAFDAVVDFDRVMRSPADPLRLDPAFDSGDHLHPNDRGYRAMAEAVAPLLL